MPNTYAITSSTELMHNYKQFELFDQEYSFKAVQTNDGHSMFFGQSTNGQLFLVIEQSGVATGWEKIEISAGLAGEVKTFAISQNHSTGAINIAIVTSNPSGNDKLYLCMNQSYSDLGWVKKPIVWNNMLDDRSGAGNENLVINDVHLPESSTGHEYIIADTDDGKGFVSRYWINTRLAPTWNAHPLSFNISVTEADKSLIGRKKSEPVDGIYTFGEENGVTQFVYTPLYNPFAPANAPNPTNFDLTGISITRLTGSFSTCKALSGETDATDLFLAGGGALYYLAAADQSQLAKPKKVLQNTLLNSLHELQASVQDDKVVVWGLNSNDQVFYFSCESSRLFDASAWSVPLPLISNVSQISHYINRVNGGLTLFANTGNSVLLKNMQDPKSSRWMAGRIELPVKEASAQATKAKSYTTSIHVTDQNNMAGANVDVTLTPNGRTNVYINHVFYALSGNPITVQTDPSGTLTIVEWINGLTGTTFNVAAGDPDKAIAIDPANIPLAKMKALDSVSALENAQITHRDGTTSPLLPSSISVADKTALAQSISYLNQAHAGIMQSASSSGVNAGLNLSLSLNAQPQSPIDYIEVLWGDLVEGFEHMGEYVIKLVKDTASEVWHFIVEVGNKVYGFIVDTVEKVAAALKSIWEKIVKGFEELWNFLKYLFDWEDMLLTRDVYKQTVKIYLHRIGEEIQSGKAVMDSAIVDAEDFIRTWADPATQHPSLGDNNHAMSETLKGQLSSDGINSAPGQLLKNHFTGNIHNTSVNEIPSTASLDPTWSGLTDLSGFIEAEQTAINDLRQQIMNLLMSASGQRVDADLETILKKIVADVAIAALALFKMAVDKVLDFLTLLIDEAIKILDTPIHIPVVSDILKDLFGIKLPSVLDALCLIVAVPATIAYKIAHGHAPFESGDESIHAKITKANTYAELQANFGQTGDKITLSGDAQAALFETFYLAGGIAIIINGVLLVIDEEVDGQASSSMSTPMMVTSVVAGITIGVASLFSLPAGIKNKTMSDFSSILSKISLISMLGFAVAPKIIAKKKGISDKGKLKALGESVTLVKGGIGSIIAIIGLVPQTYHIFEIIIDGEIKTEAGILGEMDSIQGITKRLATVAGFAGLVDQEELSKQVIIIIQAALLAVTGGMQIAEAVTEAIDNV